MNDDERRLPPQDEQAEQSVLGGMLLSKDAIADVLEALSPTDFYRPAHEAIYDCILDLYGRGEPADPITVSAELERKGELLRVGGAPYLHTLIATVPTAANAGYYAEIVAEKAVRRRLVEAGTRIVQLGYNGAEGADIEQLFERAKAGVLTAPGSARTQAASRLVVGGAFILDEPDQVPAIWGEGQRVLWAEGEGLMLAGPQGVGKTTIGQQVVAHLVGIRRGPFLGLPIAQARGRVLYLAMDRPRQAARSFRRMVTEDQRKVLDEQLVIWQGPLPVDIIGDSRAFASWVLRQVSDVAVVVVDSVKDMAAGISKDEIGAALNMAWQELIAQGVDLLLLHHGRKAQQGSQREKTLDGIYGSTWLTSGLGSVVLIDGEPGSPLVTAYHVKQPAETIPEFVIRHDAARGVSVRHSDEVPTIAEQIARAGIYGVTAREVAAVQYGSDADSAIKKAQRHLEPMVTSETVVKLPGEKTSAGTSPTRYVLAAVYGRERLTLVDGDQAG